MKTRFSIFNILFIVCSMLATNNLHAQCGGVEICDNGIDDDCDGLVDCFDPDCFNSGPCSDFYYGNPKPECMEIPDVEYKFNLVEHWRSTVSVETRTTPIVGDLDGDGFPEVISSNGDPNGVFILDGRDGSLKHTINVEVNNYLHSTGIADVDGDGLGEVFLVDDTRFLRCYNHDGTPKLTFTPVQIGAGVDAKEYENSPHPAFADFNGDGNPEIYIGNQIFDAQTGAIVAQANNIIANDNGSSFGNQHRFPVAYDVLPDGYCADCSGLELICGRTVYSVNINTNVMTEVSKCPVFIHDGPTAIADWNGDGLIDIITSSSCCGFGGSITIWDPRTKTLIASDKDANPLVNNPKSIRDVTGNNPYAGLPSIGDFDNDGKPEMAFVQSGKMVVLDTDLNALWTKAVVDVSSITTSTSFDFEGDGIIEIIYRDENKLYVLDGTNGTVRAEIPCGSGTRMELPVIADVDADGEAEIICNCSNINGNVSGQVRVFESDLNEWVPTRKVWNTANYYPVSINDDLTIPRQFQNKALVKGQDVYLAQANIVTDNNIIIHKALPDLVATVEDTYMPNGDCESPTVKAQIKICNDDYRQNVFDFDVSYYNGDPKTGGALLGTKTITAFDVDIVSSSCMNITIDVPAGDYDLYVYMNDDGSNPALVPNTMFKECDTTNNLAIGKISPCDPNRVDTFYICQGETKRVVLRGDKKGEVSSTGSFTEVNDSTFDTHPDVTSTYYIFNNALNKRDSFVVVVNDTPVVDLGTDVSICAGGLVGLDAGNIGSTYLWSTGEKTQTIEVNAEGMYAVEVTTDEGCVSADEMEVIFEDCSDGSKVLIELCEGESYLVKMNGNPLGDFSGTEAFEQVNDSSFNITPAIGTFYYFTGAVTDTFEVIVHPNPVVDLGADVVVCDAANINLDAGNVGSTYAWSTGDDTQAIDVDASGEYSVLVTTPNGCTARDTFNLTIHPNPVVNLGQGVSFCDGDSVVLDAGNIGSAYLWSTGEITQKLTAKTTGLYEVVVTDINGCEGDASITVTVNPNPVVDLGADVVVCDAANINLDAGNVGSTYAWSTGENTQAIDVDASGEYSVLVTTPNGCTERDTFNLTIHPNPVVNLGQGVSFCDGDSVVLDAGNIGSAYLWSTGEITQKLTAKTTGLYEVVVTDINGCEGDASINVTVHPNPVVDLGADVVVCDAANINLDAGNAGSTYAWSTGDDTQAIDVDASGEYSVLVTTPNGCTARDTFNLTIHPNPVVNLGQGVSFCDGDSVVLDAGNIGSAYLWSTGEITQKLTAKTTGLYEVVVTDINGCEGDASINVTVHPNPVVDLGADVVVCEAANINLDAGNAGSTFVWSTGENTQAIDIDASGEYSVLVTTPNGCTARDTFNLTINPNPVVNLGRDVSFCDGDSVLLDAENIGLSYQWTTGAETQKVTVKTTGTYGVIVTDAAGCIGKDTIDVQVNPIPVLDLGDDIEICEAGTFTLDAENIGSSYQWNTGAIAQTIDINSTGSYSVLVTSANGCTARDTLDLLIHPNPVVNLGPDVSFCAGDSSVLDAENLGSNYLWNSGAIKQLETAKLTGEYSVIVTDQNGCVGYDTMEVVVHVVPVVDLGQDVEFCAGDSIVLDAGNQGADYLWTSGSVAQKHTFKNTGTYEVQVTNANGCVGKDTINVLVHELPIVDLGPDQIICENDTVILDAGNPGMDFLWNTNEVTELINVTTSGSFDVVVTSINGCVGTDTIQVTIVLNPIVQLRVDTTVCEGSTVELNAENVGLNYWWSTGENLQTINVEQKGKYWVEVTNNEGCTSTDTFELFVNPIPEIDLGNDTIVCLGEEVVLDAGDNRYRYDWSTGAITQQITASKGGLYTVLVYDLIGCEGKDSVRLTLDSIVDPMLEKQFEICEGETVVLSADVWNKAYTYSWLNFPGKAEIEVGETGVYQQVVSTLYCKDTFEVAVAVLDTPKVSIVDLRGKPYYCFEDEETQLELTGNNLDQFTYLWTLDQERNRSITVTKGGSYEVVVSNKQCEVTRNYTVRDYCEPKLYIPNAFTPNQDGVNDGFSPSYSGDFVDFEMFIFNRWGELIYTSHNINESWDGTYKGNEVQIDVYVYKIAYKYLDEMNLLEQKSQVGHVSLIR